MWLRSASNKNSSFRQTLAWCMQQRLWLVKTHKLTRRANHDPRYILYISWAHHDAFYLWRRGLHMITDHNRKPAAWSFATQDSSIHVPKWRWMEASLQLQEFLPTLKMLWRICLTILSGTPLLVLGFPWLIPTPSSRLQLGVHYLSMRWGTQMPIVW